MTDDIVNLSQKSGSGLMDSPETLLLQALRDVRDKEKKHAFAKGDKLLIIALDTDNDRYAINWQQCGMNMSQCVALCELTKGLFKREMDY